jgi:hypothetical protein
MTNRKQRATRPQRDAEILRPGVVLSRTRLPGGKYFVEDTMHLYGPDGHEYSGAAAKFLLLLALAGDEGRKKVVAAAARPAVRSDYETSATEPTR